MILSLALFVLVPFLALLTFFLARDALRSHRRGRAVLLIVGAMAVEALAVGLGIYQVTYISLALVEAPAIPGSYVLLGRDARDQIVLSADGTFVRTAAYRGLTQRQHGRWKHTRGPGPWWKDTERPDPYDSVNFKELEPSCLRSTEPPNTFLHSREPSEVLCMSPGGSVGALLCRARGQLALCLGDEGFEFIRE